jgi:hypothetical protein
VKKSEAELAATAKRNVHAATSTAMRTCMQAGSHAQGLPLLG